MKNKFLFKISILIIVTVLLNLFLVKTGHTRIDLTKEKKYTLSKKTKEILKEIDDKIYFKIYFSGDLFTPELKSLKKEINQLLAEFRYYSKFIDYDFINLYNIENKENRNKKIYELTQNNINWTFHPKLKDNYIIWGAEISYKTDYENTISFLSDLDKEWPIECAGENENLTTCLYEKYTEKCLAHLEFSLINSIKNALEKNKKKKKIGILSGHGEKNGDWIHSFKKNLRFEGNYIVKDTILIHQSNEFSKLYDIVDKDTINYNYNLSDYDCIIINNPSDSIYFLEKIILDQYIINGGKTLWLIKGSKTNIDSLQKNPQIPIVDLNINIRNMLYKYGARINSNIARDYKNSGIKLTEFRSGLMLPFPWDYFPVINGVENHQISKGIYDMMTQFPSSIDTIKNNIVKHILLQTSEYSTSSNIMDIISFNDVDYMTNKERYTQKNIALGVLLEGKFDSNFKNRIPNDYKEKLNFKNQCEQENNMIIISDGNFITNQIGKSKESRILQLDEKNNKLFVTPELKKPLALGYDRNSFKKYNNSHFILNCIDYLLEEKQENYLFEIRKKETKINKFDKILLEENKKKWKRLNIIIPQIFVVFLFITTYIIRSQKYKS